MDTDNNNKISDQQPATSDKEAVVDVGKLQEDLKKCEMLRDEYLAGWQRAKADFVNYKKDEMKRLEDISRYAAADLVEELIAVLDNFDLGLAAMEKAGSVERGVYMIRAQIEDILRKRGLTRIPVKSGDAFDPNVHEAVAQVPSEFPEDSIVEGIEAGYRLYDKVVRPARVKISKGKTNN